MGRFILVVIAVVSLAADAEAQAAQKKKGGEEEKLHEFQENTTGAGALTQGVSESKIVPTRNAAALKFTLIDKDDGPIAGIVISLTDPDGKKFYTKESDAKGYAEVLVPVGKTYELVYLSLGRQKIAATVPVEDEPNQTIKLTLRYKRFDMPETVTKRLHVDRRFVLSGIEFDTGKATIRRESYPRLDLVLEYMTHKSSSRIQISGHTDNVGKPQANKKLSQDRAQACKDYLVSKGIDAGRIEAAGYGEEIPIASNGSEEGRQQNRRIEALEL